MALDFGGDTTGFTNEHFTSFPPQSSFERDRLRLQRELDRDLDHPSFSSSSVSGLENAGRPFNYDDDTNTFDIDNDARATSTRKVNFNAHMLQSSPPVNSRILAAEFADFSMAGNDYTEDSVEIGRAREKNLSSRDYIARAPFSSRGAPKTASKRLSEAYAAAGREMASPIPKLSRQNSIRSDTSEVVLPLNKNVLPMTTNKLKEQKNRLIEEDTLDLSRPSKKATQNPRQTSDSSTGSKPRKTTEQVSSRAARLGTAASRAIRVGDDVSSLLSIDDIVPSKTRKVSRAVTGNILGGTRGPSLKAAMKAGEAKDAAETRRKSSATGNDIPKAFKSTAAFIKELGLDGQSLNALQDPPTYDETVDLTNQNTNEQSFLLPNLAGISELINTEATRIYNNNSASARKRNPHGQPPSHKPIESIPVPQDNRDILMAMQLLQDKMVALEEQKSVTEKRCEDLKEQLKRIRQKYEKEYHRARLAEDELAKVKRSGPTTAAAAAFDVDTEAIREKAEDKERSKIAFLVEKMKLENAITSYKTQMDEISHKFEITKISLKNMQEERNSAVNSAAAAIASQRQLQEENEKIREELGSLRAERMEFEDKMNFEREAWKAKEAILRKRVDKAREAEGVAREAITGLQKRLGQTEAKGIARDGQDDGLAELVRKELERLKPQLHTHSAAAPATATAAGPSSSKASFKRPFSNALTTHSAPATVTISAALQKDSADKIKGSTKKTTHQIVIGMDDKGTPSDDANETAHTVDGNYIRRIAEEIDEERRRRKEAEKRAAVASAEMERIREIVTAKGTAANRRKSTSSKRYPESSASGREDTVTPNLQKIPPRPLSAPPTSVIFPEEAGIVVQKVSQGVNDSSKPKRKRIKKVVYYEEGDTTLDVTRSSSKDRLLATQAASTSLAKNTSPYHDVPFHNARKNSSSNHKHQVIEFDFDKHEGNDQGTLPPPPAIPEHIRSVIDAEAEHDPQNCTVCARRDGQSQKEESRIAARGHSTTQERAQGGYEEMSTMRPSKPAGQQLSKVVRTLQDEFVHLKLAYQEKAEEFLSLDPTKGRRRRKEITREISDMVAEMDNKCDMIYALYDVAEEVISIRPHHHHHHNHEKSTKAISKGKAPAQSVNFMDDSDEEQGEFEYPAPGRSGKLVQVEDVEDSGDYHVHAADTSNVNLGRGSGNLNEVSLLDETEDDTSMQVARHLARQGKEIDRQLGDGRGSQEKSMMDSFDEGEMTFRP